MAEPGAAGSRKLFGTDGVRGVAGEFLTAELALALARAATARLGAGSRIFVIRDTRESGEMLEAAVAAGIAEAGGATLARPTEEPLALRELRPLARLLEARLLALLHPCVACEEAAALELSAQVGIRLDERTRYPVPEGAGLG